MRVHESRAAAVIGRHFELDLLEQVAEVEGDALISALDEAEQARLLKGPSGRQEMTWRFPHQLICQALEAGIPQLRRQRLHLRIAEAMERLDSVSHPYSSDVAHHLYSAGQLADPARTARALTTAGDAAHAMYATEEAVQHYRRALDVLPPAGENEATRLHIEERLADLLALLGDRAAAMGHYQRLVGVHEAAGARADEARLARKIGTLHWHGGDRDRALACYRRDGFQRTATDQREAESTFTQLKGQFLIDRDGIVRWANIECGRDGLSGLGKFPTHDVLVAAARLVTEAIGA